MAHSVRNRKKRERIKRDLEKRLKSLAKLRAKQHVNAKHIQLTDVSLGGLRQNFKYRHYPLPESLLKSVPQFHRIQPDRTKPLYIWGSDGGLLLCHIPGNKPEAIESLNETINDLPPTRKHKHRGIHGDSTDPGTMPYG
jgi:hypothetical protein